VEGARQGIDAAFEKSARAWADEVIQ